MCAIEQIKSYNWRMKKEFKRGEKLSKGDKIGVVATAAPLEEQRLEQGLKVIQERGFEVVMPLRASRDYGNLSHGWSNGSVIERYQSLKKLLLDSEVKAIIAARGGYGTAQMMSLLNAELFSSNPKPIIGVSDVTQLMCYQTLHAGVCSVHGPSIGASLADAKTCEDSLQDTNDIFEALCNPDFKPSYSCKPLREGSAKGHIIAANLSILLTMLGTPWDIDYSNSILVVEDVGESPYKIHRALSQLSYAGKFDSLSGLVFGRFSKCDSKHGPQIEDVFSMVLDDVLSEISFPVYSDLQMGHWGRNVPLGLGCMAELSEGSLKMLEGIVK